MKIKQLLKFLFFGIIIFTIINLCSAHHTEASISDGKPTISPSYIIEIIYVPNIFTEKEKQLFQDAAAEWTYATGGIAHIIVVFDNNEFRVLNRFSNVKITFSIAEPLPANNIFIMLTDKAIGGDTIGYYEDVNFDPPKILIVPERIVSEEEYKSVILHELGHSLGLGHNRERFTLMYRVINSGMECITKTDLTNFCKIYGCNEENLNYCEPKIEETICLNEGS